MTYNPQERGAQCEYCPLRGQPCVPPELTDPAAEGADLVLAVIGEGPGEREVAEGRPFVGRSGKMLWRILERAGWPKRAAIHVNNATLCKPRGRTTKEADLRKAVACCRPRLERDLREDDVRFALALGQHALDAVSGVAEVARVGADAPDCALCGNTRKVSVLKCKRRKCGSKWAEPTLQGAENCPECGGELRRLKTKAKCPACGGVKRVYHEEPALRRVYKVGGVAGCVLAPPDDLQLQVETLEAVVPTFHPAALLYEASGGARGFGGQFLLDAVVRHAMRARRMAEGLQTVQDLDVVAMTPSGLRGMELWVSAEGVEQLEAQFGLTGGVRVYTDALPRAWFDADVLVVDLETDAKDPMEVSEIRCLGVQPWSLGGRPTGPAVVVDMRGLGGLDSADPRRKLAERIFAPDTPWKVAFQNGLYDVAVLQRFGVPVGNWRYDTRVAQHALVPDEPADLQWLGGKYAFCRPWKPTKREGGKRKAKDGEDAPKPTAEEQWREFLGLAVYNAKDCRVTAEVLTVLLDELAVARRIQVHDLDLLMCHVAVAMQLTGVPVDLEARRQLIARAEVECARLERELRELAGRPDLNLGSPAQLAEVLYSAPPQGFGLHAMAETAKGQASTSSEALQPHLSHPFVEKLETWRKWTKALGTYLKGIEPREGRIHPSWNVLGARTGRWSSSPNLQNWSVRKPVNMRELIAAPDGRLLVGADMGQAELRVVAALSGDAALIERCNMAGQGDKYDPAQDPHAFVASLAFKAYSTADKMGRAKLRDLAKRVVYGMLYGAGASTIYNSIAHEVGGTVPGFTVEVVGRVMQAFFEAFPRVREWQETSIRRAQQEGMVRDAILGRARVFPLGNVEPTVALNYQIQATVATVMNQSIGRLYYQLPTVDPTGAIIAQVHDAIYLEVAEDRAEGAARLLEECMTHELVLAEGARPMRFPAEAKIGKRWSEVS